MGGVHRAHNAFVGASLLAAFSPRGLNRQFEVTLLDQPGQKPRGHYGITGYVPQFLPDGHVRVISDNPAYAPFDAAPAEAEVGFKILGRVV